jgi:hypothetical protein
MMTTNTHAQGASPTTTEPPKKRIGRPPIAGINTRPSKRCRICKLIKLRADFPANRTRSDGMSSACLVCDAARRREENARYAAAWTAYREEQGIVMTPGKRRRAAEQPAQAVPAPDLTIR